MPCLLISCILTNNIYGLLKFNTFSIKRLCWLRLGSCMAVFFLKIKVYMPAYMIKSPIQNSIMLVKFFLWIWLIILKIIMDIFTAIIWWQTGLIMIVSVWLWHVPIQPPDQTALVCVRKRTGFSHSWHNVQPEWKLLSERKPSIIIFCGRVSWSRFSDHFILFTEFS